jgi:hypothetical protein
MAKNAARCSAITEPLEFGAMAGVAGRGHLGDAFVMKKSTPIQSMGGRGQNQGRIIGYPALPMTLIAGWFALKTTQKLLSVTVLAISLSPES